MKRRFISMVSFLFLFSAHSIYALDLNQTIKTQAKISADALLTNDLETILAYTHPNVLKLIGGKEKAKELIKQGQAQLNAEGVKLEAVTIGEPDPIKEEANLTYTIVPQTLSIKIPNGRLTKEGHLLAVSEDKGEHWFFVDTAGLTQEKLVEICPALVGKVSIPPLKEPLFIITK